MNTRRITGIVMALAAFGAPILACAESRESAWNVVLNGRAVHIDASAEWNESNWGLGIEKEFGTDTRWVKVALANGFKDSLGEPSYMAGGGVKRRFRTGTDSAAAYLDVGAIAFLMTREDVNESRPFPGVLPAVTIGARYVALNLTYLPQHAVNELTRADKRDPNMNGILFMQIKLDMRIFELVRR